MFANSMQDIQLVDLSGHEHAATVVLEGRDWTEGGFRKTECRITLRWGGGEVSGMSWNYFAAFQRVREQLAPLGLLPRCYGASRNVILTGMAADMGSGLKVYLAEIGRPLNPRSDLVSIFDSGPGVEPVSVEEQESFRQCWLKARSTPRSDSASEAV